MVALARMRVDPEDLETYELFLLAPCLVLQPVSQGLKKGVAQVIRERRCWGGTGSPGWVWLVKAGHLEKAVKRLELAKLAPATEETLRRLEQLHPAGTGRRREVEGDRRQELQGQALELDGRVFDDVMQNEWLAGARSVALLKDDLGVNVRPIACGEILRKLVAKVIRKQRAKAFRNRFCGRPEDGAQGLRAAQIGVAVKGARGPPGAQQRDPLRRSRGDPLRPLYLAAPLQTVLERVQERHPEVIGMAYLEDVLLMGPPVVAAAAYDTYVEEAVAIGLHIQPAKSAAYSPEGDPGFFAEEMPGARGELDFLNVLGVPVGKAEAVSAEMLRKVGELCGILPTLNKLGHAQAQGLLLRYCAHPRLGFWLRGVPPEMVREAAEEHDSRMREALRDMLSGGWTRLAFPRVCHSPAWDGADRGDKGEQCGLAGWFRTTLEGHAGSIFDGCEDLGAESDLPYIRSVQAMHKVTEAMGEIEEARGAEKHLPTQTRLPRLFTVTFDSIGPALLRGTPRCPALELTSAEYRVALRHVLHAERPLLGQVGGCPHCGGEVDPTGTHLLACE
ncbi:hypothetical protein CYMTET_13486 [Cymbomonas tetramitiformis]|uniref:Reverse transcriptase domain-containing protein n=1 Tax=Cymbomonas tetramitiformis TaxID=36881 RepID=A0AAE0LAU2_9CHLO|nr:hypothetical protein CYMTET_13486 [Cymbomonas tetramitiformis]